MAVFEVIVYHNAQCASEEALRGLKFFVFSEAELTSPCAASCWDDPSGLQALRADLWSWAGNPGIRALRISPIDASGCSNLVFCMYHEVKKVGGQL